MKEENSNSNTLLTTVLNKNIFYEYIDVHFSHKEDKTLEVNERRGNQKNSTNSIVTPEIKVLVVHFTSEHRGSMSWNMFRRRRLIAVKNSKFLMTLGIFCKYPKHLSG